MNSCSLHRWLSGLFPDSTTFAQQRHRHLQTCAACRQWHQDIAALELSLSRARPAAPIPTPLPPRLRQRVLAGLRAASPSRPPAKPSAYWLAWSAPIGLAATCVIAILLQLPQRNPSAPSTARADVAIAWPGIPGTPSVERFHNTFEQPLLTEFDTSLTQGRHLLAGMVASAVPQSALRTILQESPGDP